MGALRRHRALAAWLAIFALLGNMAAGLLCSASAGRSVSDYPADLLGPLVICTTHGEQTVPDGSESPPAPKPCQLCLTVAAATLVVALTALLLLLALPRGVAIGISVSPSPARLLHRGAHGSRAPPLPA